MLPITLKVVLIVGLLCYYILILYFLKNKSLSLKYSMLWIFAGIVLAVLVAFPRILDIIVHALGIESSMNGLFVMAIAVILAILMSLTSIVSRQNEKIKKLVEQQALMEKQIRELEKKK